MSAIKDTVFILACCVDNLQIILLIPNLDLLGEGVLDGGVVGFNEVVVDKANRQRRLACIIATTWLESHSLQAVPQHISVPVAHPVAVEDLPTLRLPTMASLRSLEGILGACESLV